MGRNNFAFASTSCSSSPRPQPTGAAGWGFNFSAITALSSRNILLSLLFTFLVVPQKATTADADDAYLFSFFRGNGEDGLHLAASTNGLQWTELNAPDGKSFLPATVGGKIMRDPCLRLGPDGVFHLVWTTSWGQPPVFGYAESRDLVHWTDVRAVPVMESEPTVENVWAPELFYNEARQEWIIFWASTIPGKFPETANSGDHNHRIYCVTTKDFRTFSPTRLFYDGGFNEIDATILPAEGKFYLVIKDETKNPVKKNLRLAVSDHAEGPYGPAGEPITDSWAEGPTAIQLGSDYVVFYDHYTKPQHFGAVMSTDMKNWRDITPDISFPRGSRHGTVLRVPGKYVQLLSTTVSTNTTNQL